MFNSYITKPPTFEAAQIAQGMIVEFLKDDPEGNGKFSLLKPDGSGENDVEFRHYEDVVVGDYIRFERGQFNHMPQELFETNFILV